MIKELEVKSNEDEDRVREMNVNVENLNMNVSLQQKTVMGLVEDRKFIHILFMLSFWPNFFFESDKEIIDAHTASLADH